MNKVKIYLLGKKLKFIQLNAPNGFDHWNECKENINFYFANSPSIKITKPLWLKIIEKFVY